MLSSSNTSLSLRAPLNDFDNFIILAFLVSIFDPIALPMTLPLTLAVIIPSIVRCLRS